MIEARIEKDSVAPHGGRITTFILTYPRFIHSELMTHRAFSRNAASSRAIPFKKMVEMLKENMATPVKWGSSKPGMQSGDEVTDTKRAYNIWENAMFAAIQHATALDEMGVHKSISNRLLEPFAHMTTIVTATDFANFFALRAHPDAQPEFQALAYKMLDAYQLSEPRELGYDDWHLPLVHGTHRELAPVSAARCARVSYVNFKETSIDEDLALHDRLVGSGHWSPLEHQACPNPDGARRSGNFCGWMQYRKLFENENITTIPERLVVAQ